MTRGRELTTMWRKFWPALFFMILAWPLACLGDANTIFTKNNAAVVVVFALDGEEKPLSEGSGFIVSADGKVATNYHVINMASKIKVRQGGRVVDVEGLTYVDSDNDLAILKLKGSRYPVVKMGDAKRLQVGEKVYAMGSPHGLENTISEGIISGIRNIDKERTVIQMTAAISPGSSGGPLFNDRGEVIGIATFLIAETQNLNFALPINLVKKGLTKNDLADPAEACRVDFKETAACFFYKGLAYGITGQHDRAVDAFKRSLGVNAKKVEVYINLGVSYANLEKFDEAIDMFNKALLIEPDNIEALAKLGAVYTRQGNYAESDRMLQRSFAIKPGDPDTHFYLALNYGSQGKYPEAAAALQEAIRLAPDHADAQGYLGVVYTAMKHYPEAASAFKAGIRLNPNDPRMHFGLGKAYASMGDKASALQEYNILKKLNPEMANQLFDLIYR